jgi:release factor glutamine methyltransferase
MSEQRTTAKTDRLEIRAALREGISRLAEAHVPSHSLAAELLLVHTLGRDRAWVYSHPESAIDAADEENYFALIARRAAGEPTQYLTGKQEFWGLEFEVNPSVLIPRPETEHVVEVALERLRIRGRKRHAGAGIRIADVGTGSGCIAVALAKELPNVEIIATDISQAALEVARRNAVRHGLARRIQFVATDLLDAVLHESRVTSHDSRTQSRAESRSSPSQSSPLTTQHSQPFTLILSNPPYIARHEAPSLAREVRDHEPDAALFGGTAGTEIYGRLIEQARALLVSGGSLVLELGYNCAPPVRSILENATDWRGIEISNDLAGVPRVIAAEKV